MTKLTEAELAEIRDRFEWGYIEGLRDTDIRVLLGIVERLQEENERLNKEIGKHTNQLFNIAQSCYKTGDEAQRLIAEMLKGNDSE